MADNIIEEVIQPTVEEQQQANQAELANLMAISLGTNLPPQSQAPVSTEGGEGEGGTGEGGEQQQQTAVEPKFKFDLFKEKFGYEKVEDIFAEIEKARTVKDVPPQPQEIKFENEQSKKLFEAIRGENKKKPMPYLQSKKGWNL